MLRPYPYPCYACTFTTPIPVPVLRPYPCHAHTCTRATPVLLPRPYLYPCYACTFTTPIPVPVLRLYFYHAHTCTRATPVPVPRPYPYPCYGNFIVTSTVISAATDIRYSHLDILTYIDSDICRIIIWLILPTASKVSGKNHYDTL